jgi:hypothetical protein
MLALVLHHRPAKLIDPPQNNLIGRKGDSELHTKDHVARPLSHLKDPSSFAPPPKHRAYYGEGASASPISPGGAVAGSRGPPRIEEKEPAPPPIPFRVNTTGIDPSILPKPPTRRETFDGARSPPPPVASRPKPSLPPQLPPRSSTINATPNSPPPKYDQATTPTAPPRQQQSYLNQSSLNNLSRAGISVPGFGIGSSTSPTCKPTSPPPPPSQGTTFAEKQAALRTASNFRNNPGSVSFSDAKAAASTANNFRERHGDQVAAGWKAGNAANKKFGLADRMGGLGIGSGSTAATERVVSPPAGVQELDSRAVQEIDGNPILEVAGQSVGERRGGKKTVLELAGQSVGEERRAKAPPPRPPPKRGDLGGGPPPIPLSSKPKFG